MTTETELTESQTAELSRLKAYFPFRIVWGAIEPTTGQFTCQATATKRQANELARKGWKVFIYS